MTYPSSPALLQRPIDPTNPVIADDGIIAVHDPLQVDIEDNELIKIVNERIRSANKFWEEKYNLTARRERTETYLFGRQIQQKESLKRFKPYEIRYLDNAIYEIEKSIKPVAMSRMPDMIVMPGQPGTQSEDTAKDITEIIDNDLKKRETRQVLALAFKHLPVYFTGIIKCVWDPTIGTEGDYRFINVHPMDVIIDETSSTNDANQMQFIAEAQKMTAEEVIMRFPEKKEEFIKEMQKQGLIMGNTPAWKAMATSLKVWEVWFKHNQKHAEDKYERQELLLWKFGDVILKKIKNPNFDYEGVKKYFTLDPEGNKVEAQPEDMMNALTTGAPMEEETVYRNFFDMPQKPYFFMGYDQWGKVALDETSRIEQNIYNQENIDVIGKRVIEKLQNRGKHIWSKESGLTGKDVERMDMNNPNQDAIVDGDVNKVHGYIPPEDPTQQEFQELAQARNRMFSSAGATNLNGVLQSDVATSNQIAQQSNMTQVDDLTEETINAAAEWMARWMMQMIKLRYTKEHMRKLLGDKGVTTFMRLKSDMIEDGMEIKIKSSGTDKLRRQRVAMDMVKAQLIDPLTFYEDMDLPDPEGRAEKLLMLQQDPAGYFMKFVKKMDVPQAAGALAGQAGTQGSQATDLPPMAPPQAQPSPLSPGAPPPEMNPMNPPQGSPEQGVL